MKMCMPHWDELREKTRALGIYGLVATSGEQAAAQFVNQAEQGVAKVNFDPLMAAHNAILSRALQAAGFAVMQDNDDGTERCPLCYLIANCPCGKGDACPIRTWTTGATDAMKEEAIRLGLVGTDVASHGSGQDSATNKKGNAT